MTNSPCNNECNLDTRTGVCNGCGRTMEEIERAGRMARPKVSTHKPVERVEKKTKESKKRR